MRVAAESRDDVLRQVHAALLGLAKTPDQKKQVRESLDRANRLIGAFGPKPTPAGFRRVAKVLTEGVSFAAVRKWAYYVQSLAAELAHMAARMEEREEKRLLKTGCLVGEPIGWPPGPRGVHLLGSLPGARLPYSLKGL